MDTHTGTNMGFPAYSTVLWSIIRYSPYVWLGVKVLQAYRAHGFAPATIEIFQTVNDDIVDIELYLA
jgi:hypothetical protein